MASSIGTAWIQIKPSMAGISKDIEKELGNAGTSGSKKLSSGILNGLSDIGGKIGDFITTGVKVASVAAGALIIKNIGGAFNRIDTLANYPKVMKNLGYETEEVAKSMKELEANVKGLPTSLSDIVGKAQQFAPISSSLDEATKTAIAFNNASLASGKGQDEANRAFLQFSQIIAKGVPDMQSWRSMQEVMPGQLSQVSKYLGIASGSTQELYDKMLEGTISTEDFRNAFISLNESGIDGFASFKDQAFDATDGIKTAFGNMDNAIQRAIASVVETIGKENIVGAIESIGKAFETAAQVVGGAINFFKEHPDIFNAIAIAVGVLVVGLTGLNIVMGILAMNPLTLAITGIVIGVAALVFGIVMLVQHLEEVGNWFSWLGGVIWDWVKKAGKAIGGFFTGIWNSITGFFTGVGDAIAGFFTGIWNKAVEIFTAIVSFVWDNFLSPIINVFSAIWNVISSIFIAIVALLAMAAEWVYNTLIAPIIGFFAMLVSWLWGNVIAPIGNFFKGVWDGIVGGLTAAINFIKDIFTVVVDWIDQKVIIPIKLFFKGVWDGIVNGVNGAIDGVKNTFTTVKNWINDKIINPIGNFFSGLWNGIKSGVSGLGDGIKTVFNSIVGFIKAPINGIIDGVNTVIGGINSLKVPDWVPGLGGMSPNLPKIPKLYHGGVVMSPTIALIGDNPAGEAVIPLDELDRVKSSEPQVVNYIGDVHIASDYDATRLLEQMGIKQDLYAKGAV